MQRELGAPVAGLGDDRQRGDAHPFGSASLAVRHEMPDAPMFVKAARLAACTPTLRMTNRL
jgi:hypothetical protein